MLVAASSVIASFDPDLLANFRVQMMTYICNAISKNMDMSIKDRDAVGLLASMDATATTLNNVIAALLY